MGLSARVLSPQTARGVLLVIFVILSLLMTCKRFAGGGVVCWAAAAQFLPANLLLTRVCKLYCQHAIGICCARALVSKFCKILNCRLLFRQIVKIDKDNREKIVNFLVHANNHAAKCKHKAATPYCKIGKPIRYKVEKQIRHKVLLFRSLCLTDFDKQF